MGRQTCAQRSRMPGTGNSSENFTTEANLNTKIEKGQYRRGFRGVDIVKKDAEHA